MVILFKTQIIRYHFFQKQFIEVCCEINLVCNGFGIGMIKQKMKLSFFRKTYI